jgi:hypothetical protein
MKTRRQFIKTTSFAGAAITITRLRAQQASSPSPSPAPSVPERNFSIPLNESLSATVHRTELGDQAIRLVGVNVDLSEALIGNRNAYVYAYNVHLPPKLTLQEKNLFIFARAVTCSDGSSVIDVSGKDKNPKPKAPPLSTRPGASGKNGEPGDRGTDAGNVQIATETLNGQLYMIANGGNGGDGGEGGDGQIGQTGPAGQTNQPGNPGLKGGDAGLGGAGGDGGDCGITLVQLHRGERNNITASCRGGKPGQGGRTGKPGDGGLGGAGGVIHESRERDTGLTDPGRH